MNWANASIEEICAGYFFDTSSDSYHCLVCGESFVRGEIFPMNGRFFAAEKAAQEHVRGAHADYLRNRIHSDSKYNALTENQKALLLLFAQRLGDKEIAHRLGLSVSTIRHQRFTFREKAKQAKYYLSLYESVFADGQPQKEEEIMPIHDKAKMVDERYVITEEERAHVLRTSFISLEPLRLKNFSPRDKKKIIILTRIAEIFEKGREYSEKEINALLREVYEDFATLRRALIEYGFMERMRDGSKYWRAEQA